MFNVQHVYLHDKDHQVVIDRFARNVVTLLIIMCTAKIFIFHIQGVPKKMGIYKIGLFHTYLCFLDIKSKSSATAGNTAGRARAMQGKLKQGAGIIKCANF